MKHKKLWIAIATVLLAALLAGYIWWYMPTTFLKNVDSADVARIEVFNGTCGERFTIESREDIEYIVSKIGDVKMRKAEYRHVDGFVYSVSFYGADEAYIAGFILNGDTIRDGAIRYEIAYETYEDPLCFEYIKAIEAKQ